ncbi:hypothetical protein ABW21_db0208350 [Orbilia brochopaga]|nr:hypothetical protein ABW21_db0208350 [Drechslerella brochopaga]
MRSFLYTASAFLATATAVLATPISLGKYVGCDVSKVTIPDALLVDATNTSNKLLPPAVDERLMRVALGYGTQNYSCSSGTVVPNGAKATLYDISCVVSNNPGLEPYLSPVVLQAGPNSLMTMSALAANFLGQQYTFGVHYFRTNFATPYFEFTDKKKFYGSVANKIPAPAGSDPGKAPDNFGAVPSLRLAFVPNMGSTYTTVYRLRTAGGQAPSGPCAWTGQRTIQYAAQYYFYEQV